MRIPKPDLVNWGSPLVALEFLTPLRLRRVKQWDDRTFGASIAWYPLVGLLIGGLLMMLDRALSLVLPPVPTAALEVAALALLSGGLHLDGIADTADGMAVQGDKADRLGVMSDGRTGPAGVMALVIVLIVLWASLASLGPTVRPAALLLAPALARWSVVPLVLIFQPARPRGLGHALDTAGRWPTTIIATLISCVAAISVFGSAGLLLMVIAAIAAIVIAWSASRMLDGITGDTHGAAIEVSQVVVLLMIIAADGQDLLNATSFI